MEQRRIDKNKGAVSAVCERLAPLLAFLLPKLIS